MNKLLLISGGSTLVFATLAVVMGVLPGIKLSRIPPGAGVEPLTALQSEGRDIYVANGCSYCHTQQVRPLPQDKVFGRPSAPGDFAYQTPELLGSERTGPDLTSIGERQPSTVWHYIHLYNPRAVVPQSIMPAFEWMFQVVDQPPPGVVPVPLPKSYAPTRGVVVPTHAADALVAYLLALKQPALSAEEGSAPAANSNAPPAGFSGPSSAPPAGGYDASKGEALFVATCAPCHQANAEGLPGAFPPLKGDPVVNDSDPTQHIRVILRGLQGAKVGAVAYGSPMPPFAGTLSDSDVANIMDYERSSWGNHGAPVTAAQVAAERAKSQ